MDIAGSKIKVYNEIYNLFLSFSLIATTSESGLMVFT